MHSKQLLSWEELKSSENVFFGFMPVFVVKYFMFMNVVSPPAQSRRLTTKAQISKAGVLDTGARQKRSYRSEREFGLVVGGVFVALGGWWVYRGKFEFVAPGLLVLGALLVFLGAVFPRALVLPSRAWMALAGVMSFVMTRVILALVFFLIVTPIGVVKRMTGWDPLRRRSAPEESYWTPYAERQRDPRHYEKMY